MKWLRTGAGAALIAAATGACAVEDRQQEQKEDVDSAKIAWSSLSNVQVGVRCQQEYQNNWQKDVGNNDVWRRCDNFYNGMGWARRGFQYNLHGAAAGFHTPDTCGWACGFVDSVDFFYMNTHGGSNASSSFFAMWDQNSYAITANMRLGASSRQNMVFTTFACDTHAFDANTWTRWRRAFEGGLVMTLGGHHKLFSGNAQSATEFASRMWDGEPIDRAWLESTWYADNSNTPASINTGVNQADCSWRKDNVRASNLLETIPLRDGRIDWWCQRQWNCRAKWESFDTLDSHQGLYCSPPRLTRNKILRAPMRTRSVRCSEE
ncbi:DUF6345 domain-containing protein [Pendulispora albinea]|uniref:DUF6345 domain-containing protein n=1 Tax=Pendulispora albinea TaxID=2741071 RepID=A0ABZ2LND1_9BACT